MDCPNFTFGNQPRYNRQWGYLVGYNYLGDANMATWSRASSAYWHSPRRTTESGTNYILADANHWGGGLLMVPHGKSGPYRENGATFTRPSGGAPTDPLKAGAAGGNVGYLDGSARWINIDQMKRRFASSYLLYFGYW
jgi:hypothetical protein